MHKIQLLGDDGCVIAPEGKNTRHEKISENDFKRIQVIGEGEFGKIILVTKKNSKKKRLLAMKIISKQKLNENKKIVEHTKTEKTILQCFTHPFIVKMYFAFQSQRKLYLLMKFIKGGDLFYHIKKNVVFNIDVVKIWAAEMFLALSFLHENNVIYRDLKPENILVSSKGHLILSDFGLAKILKDGDDRAVTFCGSPEYLPPEVLLNAMEENPKNSKGYNKPVDWWAYGCVIFELLYGNPPFYDEDLPEMYGKILECELKFPKVHLFEVSPTTKDFITKLLQFDPNKRLNASKIKAHDFFKGIDFDKIYKCEHTSAYIPEIDKNNWNIDDEEIQKIPISTPIGIKSKKTNKLLSTSFQKQFDDFYYEAQMSPRSSSSTIFSDSSSDKTSVKSGLSSGGSTFSSSIKSLSSDEKIRYKNIDVDSPIIFDDSDSEDDE